MCKERADKSRQPSFPQSLSGNGALQDKTTSMFSLLYTVCPRMELLQDKTIFSLRVCPRMERLCDKTVFPLNKLCMCQRFSQHMFNCFFKTSSTVHVTSYISQLISYNLTFYSLELASFLAPWLMDSRRGCKIPAYQGFDPQAGGLEADLFVKVLMTL